MKLTKQLLMAGAMALTMAACNGNKDYLITIHTPYGDMKAVLFNETVAHKENFIKLAREGKYDSTIFHRVIDGFMIQGGDVNLKKPNAEKEPEYTIPAEFTPKYFHSKGAIAAARQSDQINPLKASSGTQFYIVQGEVYKSEDDLTVDQSKLNMAIGRLLEDSAHADLRQHLSQAYSQAAQTNDFSLYAEEIKKLIPMIKAEVTDDIYYQKQISKERLQVYTTVGGTPHLDDEYTVFGKVVEGLEVIDKIAAVKTGNTQPLVDIFITVEVEEVSEKELTAKYGIQYPHN